MTRIEASAPGKLVLLGEYAVLEDAPALVLAVNRRARVTLTAATGNAWEIVSPTLDLEARLRIGKRDVEWCGHPLPELAWLAGLFAQIPFARTLAPCRVELDSDPFFLEHAGTRVKLGLGSSAALTVALLGALHACARLPAPTLAECISAHRAIQHGRGSGIDIAASLAGGLSRFRLDSDHAPHCNAVEMPAGLRWCCVFSGQSASTSEMLAAVAEWRGREPGDYTRHIDELATISSRGVDAVAEHDAAALLCSLHDYALALARFGESSGTDIASRVHRELGSIAAGCDAVYKSCGAGSGDVGITFAVDDVRLREFATRAAQAGYPVIGLEPEPKGLDVVVTV